MQLSPMFADAVLTQVAATPLWFALHTGDPGTTGAYEVTTSPYVRVPISWSTPVGGALSNAVAVSCVLPPGVPAFFFGVWTETIGGDFWWGGPLVAPGASGIVFPVAAPLVLDVGALSLSLP